MGKERTPPNSGVVGEQKGGGLRGDATCELRLFGVRAQRPCRSEGAVAFDGKAELSTNALDVRHAHVAEFRMPVPKVTEAKRDV